MNSGSSPAIDLVLFTIGYYQSRITCRIPCHKGQDMSEKKSSKDNTYLQLPSRMQRQNLQPASFILKLMVREKSSTSMKTQQDNIHQAVTSFIAPFLELKKHTMISIGPLAVSRCTFYNDTATFVKMKYWPVENV